MKENTETISELIFTHYPSEHTRGNLLCLLIDSLKKHVLASKDQMQSGAAALGIGVIFLFSAYLFLVQLAEGGWQ